MKRHPSSIIMVVVWVIGAYACSWADLDDGLIAYFPLDESVADESGNGHHGTIGGAVATWTAGHIGGALNFNGGSYVEVANSPDFNALAAITIAVWINPSSYSWAQSIVYKGDMLFEPYFLRLSNDEVHGYIRNSSAFVVDLHSGHVSVQSWHHAALTYDGTFVRTFLDGLALDSAAQSGPTYGDTENLFIGATGEPIGQGYFDGSIDEVRIYNRALSPPEICALAGGTQDTDEDGVPDLCDVCLGYDDLADSDGDSVPDGCDLCPRFATPGNAPVRTGDVNVDGSLTSADIISLVNFVFKGDTAPQPISEAGDTDCSGAVTAADIIQMVNHVFKGGPAPCDVCALP